MRLILLLISTGVLALSPIAGWAQVAKTYIVIPQQAGVYLELAEHLKGKIASKSLPQPVYGRNQGQTDIRRIVILTAQQWLETDKNNNELSIAIGGKVSKALAAKAARLPVLYSFIDLQTQKQLLLNHAVDGSRNWQAVLIEQPLGSYVSLANKLIKSSARGSLVLVYGDGNTAVEQQLSQLRLSLSPELWQRIKTIKVQAGQKPAKLVESSLFNAAALIAVRDKQVWAGSNLRWMLHQAYNYRVPVVAYSPSFNRAGAMVSLSATRQSVLDTVANQAVAWQANKAFVGVAVLYAPGKVDINKSIARALRYSADKLEEELKP